VPREEKMWIYTSTPPYSFMTEHRDNIKWEGFIILIVDFLFHQFRIL
jgi:hypothetical protein